LNKSASLVAVLEDMGFDDDTFAQTVLWIWATVLGAVQFEIFDHKANPRLSETEFAELSESVRTGIGKVNCFLMRETQHQLYFEFQIEKMMDALGVMRSDARNGVG
jgi:hypothetical protein